MEMQNKKLKKKLCMKERKILETLNQIKQKVVLKYSTKGNKESIFLSLFLSLMWFKSISTHRVRYMVELYALLHEISTFIYTRHKPMQCMGKKN